MARRKRDYYVVLGLTKGASEADIKRAFRELARKHHPDVNPLDAGEAFREINEAYAVLSDPDSRARYDRWGHGDDGGGGLGSVVDAAQEMLNEMLRRRRHKQKGVDLRYTLEVTFEEAAFGAEKSIRIAGREHAIVVPAGTKEGLLKTLKGEGEAGKGGAPAGDLHVNVRIAEHASFRREGLDVHSEHTVTFAQAALGAVIDLPTLDGPVKMRVPPGTQPGPDVPRSRPRNPAGVGQECAARRSPRPRASRGADRADRAPARADRGARAHCGRGRRCAGASRALARPRAVATRRMTGACAAWLPRAGGLRRAERRAAEALQKHETRTAAPAFDPTTLSPARSISSTMRPRTPCSTGSAIAHPAARVALRAARLAHHRGDEADARALVARAATPPMPPPSMPSSPRSRAALAAPPVDASTIAVLLPLSGRFASVGAELRAAIELAPVQGTRWLFLDTRGEPDGAAAAVDAAIAHGAVAILGPVGAREALAAARAAVAPRASDRAARHPRTAPIRPPACSGSSTRPRTKVARSRSSPRPSSSRRSACSRRATTSVRNRPTRSSPRPSASACR